MTGAIAIGMVITLTMASFGLFVSSCLVWNRASKDARASRAMDENNLEVLRLIDSKLDNLQDGLNVLEKISQDPDLNSRKLREAIAGWEARTAIRKAQL